MAMKYYGNKDIASFTANFQLTAIEKLDLLYHAGMALSTMHKRGFIHRDVKPHNILIDDDYSVVFADMMTVCSMYRTKKSIGKGTPVFMMDDLQTLIKAQCEQNSEYVKCSDQLLLSNDLYGFAKTMLAVICEQELIQFSMLSECVHGVILSPYQFTIDTIIDCLAYELNEWSKNNANSSTVMNQLFTSHSYNIRSTLNTYMAQYILALNGDPLLQSDLFQQKNIENLELFLAKQTLTASAFNQLLLQWLELESKQMNCPNLTECIYSGNNSTIWKIENEQLAVKKFSKATPARNIAQEIYIAKYVMFFG